MASSYAPNESTDTITQEKTWLQGAFLSNAFFGIQVTLAIMSFFAVLHRRSPDAERMRIILLVYIAVLFPVTLAAQGLLLEFIQMGFITERDYPGGPNAFLNEQWATPVNLASNILVIFSNWMMESLLVWRCQVICSTGERWWWLGVAIPALFLVAVFASTLRHRSPSSSPTASSLALNITATGFITARLLFYRRYVVKHLGRGHGQHYVSIAAVIVESAAIYTSFLVVVIVAYAIGSPATNLLQQVIEQVQRGEGWSQSSTTQVVSVIASSWDTRVGPHVETDTVHLEPIPIRPDEGGSVRREQESLDGGNGRQKKDTVV
ncbi:hypothetical protein JVU11DRAFT_6062 [Chiua virens]|nr:hypothetical protein JVU11DRAFT_6062 [Chiua virens]